MARVKQVMGVVLRLGVVAGLAAGGWFGYHSEAFQRALGKREDTKLVADQVRPEYRSVVVENSYTMVVPGNPSTVEVSSSVTVDPTLEVAKEEMFRRLTGLDAMQTSVGSATDPERAMTRVWTSEFVYTAGAAETDPWQREATIGPYTRGTYLDPYLVPVRNDVIGLELATLPWRDPNESPTEQGGEAPAVPQVPVFGVPDTAKDLRRWSFDLGTFRTLSPVAWAKTPFTELASTTAADVTMGFDAAGVLQYLQVTIDPMQADATDGASIFSYRWRVQSVSDASPGIDLPTNVVDAPADTPITGPTAVAPAP